jgi:hypothetical protein
MDIGDFSDCFEIFGMLADALSGYSALCSTDQTSKISELTVRIKPIEKSQLIQPKAVVSGYKVRDIYKTE